MRLVSVLFSLCGLALAACCAPPLVAPPLVAPAAAAPPSASLIDAAPPNLLRNGRFQDDWISLLLETKNHHWCYSSEFYNRKDDNPDGWSCKGSWQWAALPP